MKYIIDFTKKKIKELGLDEVEVKFNHRMTSIGRCTNMYIKRKYEDREDYEYIWEKCEKIQFHNSVNTLTKEQQEQIALHEIAHYIQAKEYGWEQIHLVDKDAHGTSFKKICKDIGCTYMDDTTSFVCGKYFVVCEECGNICSGANRMSKKLKEIPYIYVCGKCEGHLKIVQNY